MNTAVVRAPSAQTLLRLGRVSNLPTVWTNVIAGATIANTAATVADISTVGLAMTAFYVGGMYLNDFFDREIDARERPGRPIHAGDIGAAAVSTIGFALLAAGVAFLAPFVAQGGGLRWMFGGFRWQVPAALAVALLCVGALPVAADISTTSPTPFAELPDGSTPKVPLIVGSGPATAEWVSTTAGAALPPPGGTTPTSASARVWLLPPYPTMSVAANVRDFDPSVNSKTAAVMAHDIVLDLIIESEARRAHDLKLAQLGANGDGLTEFTDVIKQDIAAKKFVQKTYVIDQLSLQLYLPKFATQASRLEGIYVHGTQTLTTRDASGNVLSKATSTYAKTWGLGGTPQDISGDPSAGSYQLIQIDYTGLAPAP